MLKSRYHAVFLGLTPYSLVHALLLRKKGQDVLVVDDAQLATDSPGLRRLTILELKTLKDLGDKHQLAPLQQLHHFLRPSTITIHLPTTQWVSGPRVLDNLREFVRKFSFLQTPLLLESLRRPNEELHADLDRAASEFIHWFNSPLVRSRAMPVFNHNSQSWLSEFQRLLFEEHGKAYAGPEVSPLTQLLAAYSATTDQVVKYDLTAHESWAMVLRLLSPVWELDRRWFERELMRELHEQGGHTKKTAINSWQIYQQRVEAALLNSYEGVISHDRLLLYGLPPMQGQLQCHFDSRTFRGVEFGWKQPQLLSMDEQSVNHLMVFSSSGQMGTTIPLGFYEGQGEEGRLVALVAQAPGAKLEFSHSEAWSSISGHLNRALPFEQIAQVKATPRRSWGHWVEDLSNKSSVKVPLMHHERRSISIVDRVSREPITGVEFWGPLRARRFGTIGYLADLRADQG